MTWYINVKSSGGGTKPTQPTQPTKKKKIDWTKVALAIIAGAAIGIALRRR